jgi:hypothetical protein
MFWPHTDLPQAGEHAVIKDMQHKPAFADDDMVEVAIAAASLAPECIADAGLVHQGGLRRLMPWLFGG